jgi:RNase P subunit RPR2
VKNAASKRRVDYLKGLLAQSDFNNEELAKEYVELLAKMKTNGGQDGN